MATSHDVGTGLSRVLQNASVSQIVTTLFTIAIVRLIVRAFYRAYFHPLSRFPGPKLSAATRIPYLRASFFGRMPAYISAIHEEYGPVARISPNELSFADPQAWRDVHGHGSKGTAGSVPTKHWERYGKPVNGVNSLLTAKDDQHSRMRRLFNPAFSDRALKQQEPLFMKYVDLLIQKLNEGIAEDPDRKFDMVRMYNFTTFDVMGDLTFGEPLHMLSKAEYSPWVSIIFSSIRFGTRMSVIQWYPLISTPFKAIFGEKINQKRLEHFHFSSDRVTKRLETGSENADIWNLVMAQEEGEKGLSRDEMNANAGLFMIAGTETTATLVSGLTFLLLENPNTMQKLVDEIRSAFPSSHMTMEEIAALPYLNACLKEALRLYPPVPVGLPRLSPPNGSTVCGEFVPPGFSISVPQLAMYTSERNFKDALSFVPERWLGDERYADDNKFALQPFSFGTRDCLGKNMAYHEMRLIITKVLYNFDLELCPESNDWRSQKVYTLWEKKPLILKLRRAQRS